MTRAGHSAGALLLGLVACQPVVYELSAGAMSEGAGTTGQVPMTTSDATTGGTGSGFTGPPPDCDGMSGGGSCGAPGCPRCPSGHPCEVPQQCETDACIDGLCAQPECDGPADCDGVGPCRTATCEGRRCQYTDLDGVACDDGDLCATSATCQAGVCVKTPVDCSELDDDCNKGFCNPATGNCGVEHLPPTTSCQGDWCVKNGWCAQGTCVGTVYFEDFDGPPSWTLGELWQIGPAQPSTCAEVGSQDPADDHTPGPGGALAGAVIGGCLPQTPLAMDACLTSPPLDVMIPGPIFLAYASRLSSPPAPAAARVEVWDGQQWVLLDIDGEVDEPGWTEHVFEVSPFTDKGMRVRFCHHLPAQLQAKVAGWSVDDVKLGASACPPMP